jgi:hypothetical protein
LAYGEPRAEEQMKHKPRRSVDELMDEGTLVDAALRRAARDALRRHKLAGVPIAVWRDGRTVEIPPARIKIPVDRPEGTMSVPGRMRPDVSESR